MEGLLPGKSEDAPYDKKEMKLSPDDTIVTFTDGVTEAENDSGDFFDEERVIKYLEKHPSKVLFLEVMKLTGAAVQSDDITVLSVRYSNSEE